MADAWNVGDVALAEVGCCAYFRSSPMQDASTVRGGLIVRREEKLDEKTGEISTVFLTLTRRHGKAHFDRLAAEDVGAVEGPNAATLRAYARMLQEGNGKCRGPATMQEVEHAEMALQLYQVIGAFR